MEVIDTTNREGKLESGKMIEPDDNIMYTCKDCSDEIYPLKGKFSAETVKSAIAAKFLFSEAGNEYDEHMWLTDISVSDDTVTGKLDNDPVHIKMVVGEIVTRKLSDVEELLFD